jgi:catechol 2,3-dioxygenase-like lactoylglutathione lyase family enzyme
MGITPSKAALDVGIVTTNAEAMRAFYVEALGFLPTQVSTYPGVGTIERLEFGESILRLLAVEVAPVQSSPDGLRDATGLRFLTLNVTDVAAAHDACQAAGVHVVGPPSALGPTTMGVRAQDPDGNWLEFVQEVPTSA